MGRQQWLATASFLALFGAVQVHAQQAAAPARSEDEIIVTATKRAQSLQSIPLAVSAVTSEALIAKSADSLVDYARGVPGLSFTDSGAGRQRLAVRGVDSKIGSPVVGYYLGESPIPGSRGTIAETVVDPRLFDIERIEVLRGPQGTLYGSGSMGGTVRIIPKRPVFDRFEAEIEGEGTTTKARSSSLGYGLNAMVNAPIVNDRIALRLVGWHRDIDGFVDRRVNGAVVKANVPGENTSGVRGTIDIRLGDGWTSSTSAMYQRQHFNGFQDITTGASNPRDRLQQNFLFDVPEINTNSFQLYNELIEGDLGFAKLLSSTSYFQGKLYAQEETGAFFQANLGIGYGAPISESNANKDFTQEIRLTSNEKIAGFSYIVGAYYNHNHGDRAVNAQYPGFSQAFFPVSGDNLFASRGLYRSRQVALFGEVSHEIGRAVTLTAGARWFDARNTTLEVQNGLFAGVDAATPPPLSSGTTLVGRSKGVIYKFNASWQIDHDNLLYLQAAQGFRPGLAQAKLPAAICGADLTALGIGTTPAQLNADKLWNYEAGWKASLSRRLTLNLSLYQIDWKSIQQAVFLNCGFRIYVNGPNVRNRGLEADFTLKATDALRLGGSLSYIQSKFRQPLLGFPNTQGQPLPDVPKWSASSFAEYRDHLGHGWDWLARGDFSYTAGTVSAYGIGLPPGKDKGALSLLDARLGIEGDHLSVALFGRNLLNDIERTSLEDSLSANVPDRLRYSVNRPRTFGVDVRYRF